MPLNGLLVIISFLRLQTPVPRPWLSPLLSLTLGTGSRLSLPSPLVSIFLIRSSVRVFNTGWGSLCWRRGFGARCVNHRPICQSPADLYGDHQVGCGGNGDRIHRHNSLRDALYSAAQSAALAPRKEVPALIPGTSSRPADVSLPIWKRGQPAALDVTLISTLQNLTVAGAASTQSHTLSVATERKMALHSTACHSVGVSFFHWWSNLWGVGATRRSTSSSPLADCRGSASEFLPMSLHSIYSSV